MKGRVSARKWSHFLDGGGGAPDLCFTPSIHHITEDARKLLRPPGSLASDRLSSQPAQCGGGGGGAGNQQAHKHKRKVV